MTHLIDKDALVTEIERRIKRFREEKDSVSTVKTNTYKGIISFINDLEVIDPYEQRIQYASIEDGIKAHAEDYSFNIESELFNQLTKEQQALWRKEIEQAVVSGGEVGYELARDMRYKENFEVKEVEEDKVRKGE